MDWIVLKSELQKFLKNCDKLVILGIGNDMRGDDALGCIIAHELSKKFASKDSISIFNGGSVPENFTGAIKKEKPSHIILVDAVNMKKDPGYIRLVLKDEISKYNISTHAMPISFLINYLEFRTNAQIILIGMQPKKIDLGDEISHEVKEGIIHIVNIFEGMLEKEIR
ncbi:MAG: hydrogenase maturation peptidase HycI [Methanomicrobiales archaeon]